MDICFNDPGVDAREPDAGVPCLHRKRRGDRVQRVLCRAIRTYQRERHHAGHRADVYDPALPPLHHARQHLLDQPHRAEKVCLKLGAEGRHRDVFYRAGLDISGVVDKCKYLALCSNVAHHCVKCLRPGRVKLDRDVAPRRKLCGQGFQPVVVSRKAKHQVPGFRERGARRFSYSA